MNDVTILDIIAKYWTILVFLAGLIATWTRMSYAISALQQRDDTQDDELKAVRIELKANNAQFTQLQVDIQAIKTALEYIKTEMARK